jgi:ribosome recycling factor
MVRNLVEAAKPKMEKAIEHLNTELGGLRTGRASVALVDSVLVESYGTMQPLKAVASVNTPDARTIAIAPWDKSLIPVIEKAIRDTPSLGLNPMNDGNVIRLNIPALTEDRRREIVKSLGGKVEECRITMRNIRHDVLKEVQKMEKAKEATQDDTKFAETELNKQIDQFQKKIEEIEAAKTKELMEI